MGCGCRPHGLALVALLLCARPALAQSGSSRLPPVAGSTASAEGQTAPAAESPGDFPWSTAVDGTEGIRDLRPLKGESSSESGSSCPWPGCDAGPTRSIVGLVGYDSWRGVSDESWQNNGIHSGFNLGSRLGRLSELTGIGGQIGGTVGVYDWSGTDYRPGSQQSAATTQGFMTYGLFHKPNDVSRWNAGIVQDWMFANNFGSFGQSVTLSQLRMQLGYAVSDRDEFGAWGTCRLLGQTRNVSGVGPTTYRPIDQVSLYWHHKWTPGGADTWLSVGVPQTDRLAGGGSLGSWLVSLVANVPLSDRVALYNSITYMHPSAHPGAVASEEDAWNFSIGLAFYPGRTARSSTVAGQCWLPQMPVANNGSFLTDASNH